MNNKVPKRQGPRYPYEFRAIALLSAFMETPNLIINTCTYWSSLDLHSFSGLDLHSRRSMATAR